MLAAMDKDFTQVDDMVEMKKLNGGDHPVPPP